MDSSSRAYFLYFVLLFSLPVNFVVFDFGGSLYLTTIVIFVLSSLFFVFVVFQGFVAKVYLFFILIFLLLLFFSLVSFFAYGGDIYLFISDGFKYFQLAFSVPFFLYVLRHVKEDSVLSLFLIIVVLCCFRFFYEFYDVVFKFSTLAGERPYPAFAGGFNNFALIVGIAFLVAFFRVSRPSLRYFLLFLFGVTIISTLSRGAIFCLFLSLVMVFVLSRDKGRYLNFFLIFLMASILLIFVVNAFWDLSNVYQSLTVRFFSVFLDSSVTVSDFSSGRDLILVDFWERISESTFSQFFLGHGFGSIAFHLSGSHFYESTHNNYLDVLYKNGAVFFVLGVAFIMWCFFRLAFGRQKIFYLAIFVFFHLEIFLNPFLFSIQVNWIYGFVIALVLRELRFDFKLIPNF